VGGVTKGCKYDTFGVMNKKKKDTRKRLYMTEETYEKLKAAAKKNNRSMVGELREMFK